MNINTKKLLIEFLSQAQRNLLEINQQISILPDRIKKYMGNKPVSASRLTSTQERFWLYNQLNPESTAHNMSLGLHINGEINIDKLKQSILLVCEEQPLLGGKLNPENRLEINALSEANIPFHYHDCRGYSNQDIALLLQTYLHKPFNLYNDILWRLVATQLADDVIELHLVMHHLICDAFSFVIFFNRLSAYYRDPHSIRDAIQHKYYKNMHADTPSESDVLFWKSELSGFQQTRLFNENYTFSQGYEPLQFEIQASLITTARELKTSEYVLLLASLYLTLANVSGVDDFIIGTMFSARGIEDKQTIGCYSNTLPIRINPSSKNINEFIGYIATKLYSIFKHQRLPLQEILRTTEAGFDRQTGLFDCLFIYQNTLSDITDAFGLHSYLIDHDAWKSYPELPLFLHIRRTATGYKGTLEFKHDVISIEKIKQIRDTFIYYLNSFQTMLTLDLSIAKRYMAHPSITFGNKSVINRTLHEIFASVENQFTSEIAIYSISGTYTYAQLFCRANQFANYLLAQGVKENDKIGVSLRRDVDLIAVIIAIVKVGAVYVPLDPTLPHARLQYMSEAVDLNVLLTDNEFTLAKIKTLELVKINDQVNSQNTIFQHVPERSDDDFAYIIFTSGSTGNPKATAIYNKSLINFIEWARSYFTKDEISGYSAVGPISFDVSIFDIFVPIACGGSIILIENILHVTDHPYKDKIRTFSGTNSAIKALFSSNTFDFNHLSILFYGEAVQIDFAHEMMRRYALKNVYNLYGPVEATVYITAKKITLDMLRMTVGHPINNANIYILDENNNPVPIGTSGEIYIGGIPVSYGYLNNETLRKQSFLPDPFVVNGIMYKTGDMGRMLDNGEIYYEGRNDFQIKIAGRRVDLLEIESKLRELPEIFEAAIVTKKKNDIQSNDLVALYQATNGEILDAIIKNHFMKNLPDYMHPGKIIRLNNFPTNHNGKIDRKALLDLIPATTDIVAQRENDVSEDLQVLEDIWKYVLKSDHIDTTKSFFENGGYSLQIPDIVAQIKYQLAVDIKMTDLFKYTTLRELATYLQSKKSHLPHSSSIHTQQKMLSQSNQDIAIIGIGFKLPHDINTKADLWKLLVDGGSLASGLSKNRLRYYPDNYIEKLGLNTNDLQGFYFDDVDGFDAGFFQLSTSEAAYIDPQQRWLLQSLWHCIEDAGYIPDKIGNSNNRIGCFVGASFNDYKEILSHHQQSDHPYVYTGNSLAFLANRLSYYYNFTGPSLTVDTTCSSSLIALNLAVQSLRAQESEIAFVSSCGLLFNLNNLAHWKQFGVLSSTGRCATFSENADGFIPGEAIFTLMLKPLAAARHAGDHIYGVIKGVSVNHDGHQKMSMTATSQKSQTKLFQRVCQDAQCTSKQINYIEAHGTGTKIGDPIEIEAYSEVMTNENNSRCALGSIKTILGHTGPAAGLASIIKCLLSFEHKELPPTRLVGNINPEINFGKSSLFINQSLIPWDFEHVLVSSLGFGGSNGFTILKNEKANSSGETISHLQDNLFVLSAKSKPALHRIVKQYQEFLSSYSGSLHDLCATLQLCKSRFPHKLSIKIDNLTDLKAVIASIANSNDILQHGLSNVHYSDGMTKHEILTTSKLDNIANKYHQAADVEWQLLYQHIHTISHQLPVYPFEETHCSIVPLEQQVTNPKVEDRQWLYQREWVKADFPLLDLSDRSRLLIVSDYPTSMEALITRLHDIDKEYTNTDIKNLDKLDIKPDTSTLSLLLGFNGDDELEALLENSVGLLFKLAQLLASNATNIKFVNIVVHQTSVGINSIICKSLSALIKAFQYELVNIKFKIIIYAESAGYDLLLTELLSSSQADEVILSQGSRLCRSIVPISQSNAPIVIQPNACYVVTGGSGGIATVITKWLIDEYAATVIHISRKTKTKSHDSIHHIVADVSDEKSLAYALQQARAIAPIKGIFHLAGSANSQPILQKSFEHVIEVIKPKVFGTVNLEKLTRNDSLDFIVLFSSIASIIGNAYQAEYSFANAFLNEFATQHYRAERPIISINWGTWHEAGMVKDYVASSEYYHSKKDKFISNELGIHYLSKSLTLNIPEIIVASDWQLFPSETKSLQANGAEKLRKMTAKYIQDKLITAISEKLNINRLECDIDQPFIEMGIDSVAAVDLVITINKFTGVDFKHVLFFEYPTISKLTKFILEKIHATDVAGEHKPAIVKGNLNDESFGDHHDIAVIGIACEFPGAKNIEDFWRKLVNKENFITEIPSQHKHILDKYSLDKEEVGTTYSKWGGYLDSLDDFDYPFFNISKAEAIEMDPQQKLALRLSWSVLESAAYATSLRDENVGVYIGTMTTPYRDAAHASMTAKTLLTNSNAILANRLSYYHGFSGPSLMVDTLCSSSLVALDMAVNSLRQRKCQYAMVGGIRVGIPLEHYVGASRMKVLSAAGRCASFSEGADGFVPGEGGVMLLLRPLPDAIKSGDKIWAVIKGSAVNHGGQASGMTAPSAQAQRQLIRTVLQDAKLAASDISYIEAHGTGTELGDPIEVSGLTQAYSEDTKNKQYCALGSVKTNIGHTEPVAGLAGVTKVILAMNNHYIPANLHLSEPNRHIEFSETPFYLLDDGKEWHDTVDGKRRAGVSSFGIGGTNAHVILESWKNTTDQESHYPEVVLLSGRSEAVLKQQQANLLNHLQHANKQRLIDIAYSLATGRQHFPYRSAYVVQDKPALIKALTSDQLMLNCVKSSTPKIGFLFTGQGSQYVGMGKQLFEFAAVFREHILNFESLLKNDLPKPLRDILWNDGEILRQTRQTQPCLFALEYSLAMQLKSWGIEPEYVIGHSLGEYVAACVSGTMDVNTALKQVLLRARLMDERIKTPSGMLAVMASEKEINEKIISSGIHVEISGNNHQQLVTVAGLLADIDAFSIYLQQCKIKHVKLDVSHGFHSYVLEPMLSEFESALSSFTYHEPQVTLISNVTGDVLATKPDAMYWRKHVRQPVRYMEGLQTIERLGCDILLEIGPDAVMIGMGKKVITGNEVHWQPSLTKGKDDVLSIMQLLANLHIKGVKINWTNVYKSRQAKRLSLPLYPFERKIISINNNQHRNSTMLEPKIHFISTGASSRESFITEHQEKTPTNIVGTVKLHSVDQMVMSIIADTLQINVAELPIDVPLLELGADSLILSSAISSLNKHFSKQISIRQIFTEIKTTEDIIKYFN